MTTGTGIAVAGVWIMVGMAFYSPSVSSSGTLLAIFVASIVTYALV